MQKLACDICGGAIEMMAGGQRGVCTCCGMEYSVDRIKEIYSGMKVSVTGSTEDVEQWKASLKIYLKNFDFSAAENTARKILDANPSDKETIELYEKIQDWKLYETNGSILIRYRGCKKSVRNTIWYNRNWRKIFSR